MDEESELQPYLLIKEEKSNNLSTIVDSVLKYVIFENRDKIIKSYPGAEALSQFASPGVQGYSPKIDVFSDREKPAPLLQPRRLRVYTSIENLTLAAQIGNLLTPYNISFDIIPVQRDELQDSIKTNKGDLYLIQFDYRSSPSLGSLYQYFGDEIEDEFETKSFIEQQSYLENKSRKEGTNIGYPLFETIYTVAECA